MADNTTPNTNSIGNNWPEESIEIPSNPEDDSDAEKFGAAPQMQMLTPVGDGVKVKADPRTLPGSFFFMDVFPAREPTQEGSLLLWDHSTPSPTTPTIQAKRHRPRSPNDTRGLPLTLRR